MDMTRFSDSYEAITSITFHSTLSQYRLPRGSDHLRPRVDDFDRQINPSVLKRKGILKKKSLR